MVIPKPEQLSRIVPRWNWDFVEGAESSLEPKLFMVDYIAGVDQVLCCISRPGFSLGGLQFSDL